MGAQCVEMSASAAVWLRVAACACVLWAASGAPPPMDPEMAELAAMLRESCAAETGVDLGLIDKINGGADLMPDAALKCYMKCLMETAGMMSAGAVDVEATIAMLPDALRDRNAPAMRSCGSPKGSDDCDTAFITQQCWQKANKDDYFLI